MSTKITAARISAGCGADLVIANGEEVGIIRDILDGKSVGTLFPAHRDNEFNLTDYLYTKQYPAGQLKQGEQSAGPKLRGSRAAGKDSGPEDLLSLLKETQKTREAEQAGKQILHKKKNKMQQWKN